MRLIGELCSLFGTHAYHLVRNITGLEDNPFVEEEDTYEGIASPQDLCHNTLFSQKQIVTDEAQTAYLNG